MIWNYFIIFSLVAVVFWAAGSYSAWKDRRMTAIVTTTCGLCVFFAFILFLWISLQRPPLRTMGETRLWYAFFLPLAGVMVYTRWRYRWILSFSTLLAIVFICINILKPEIHSKSLMPALQSPWFAPHVIVYMFAYALFGAATMMAAYLLIFKKAWHPDGGFMGQGGLGTLLELGPKGNMGSSIVVLLSCLYPLSSLSPIEI